MPKTSKTQKLYSFDFDDAQRQALVDLRAAMVAFKRVFRDDFSISYLAEIYAARVLNLDNVRGNKPGYDAICRTGDGVRYQVKCYASPNINFTKERDFDEFDYLILVNLTDDYIPAGMWMIDAATVKSACIRREHKRGDTMTVTYQTTQDVIKGKATSIPLPIGKW